MASIGTWKETVTSPPTPLRTLGVTDVRLKRKIARLMKAATNMNASGWSSLGVQVAGW